jgi:hypothetical protein
LRKCIALLSMLPILTAASCLAACLATAGVPADHPNTQAAPLCHHHHAPGTENHPSRCGNHADLSAYFVHRPAVHAVPRVELFASSFDGAWFTRKSVVRIVAELPDIPPRTRPGTRSIVVLRI